MLHKKALQIVAFYIEISSRKALICIGMARVRHHEVAVVGHEDVLGLPLRGLVDVLRLRVLVPVTASGYVGLEVSLEFPVDRSGAGAQAVRAWLEASPHHPRSARVYGNHPSPGGLTAIDSEANCCVLHRC